ncbi:MAG: hypothetical protein ACREDR_39835 [Blastocatellia bacterium]
MSIPKDPIVSDVIQLNPGFRWKPGPNQPEVEITEAQVQLLKHGDHNVCNLMEDKNQRERTRFRFGIRRLGSFIGRDQVTDEMIDQMYEPDVMRIEQAQVDLHQRFLDRPNVVCPLCKTAFSTALINPTAAEQKQA